MKRLWLLLLAACASAMPPAPAPAPAPNHVLLISIDGLRPDFYLEDRFEAPTLKALAKEGAHARGVVSVFPSVTYPSHATIVTGTYPDKHGVLSNTRWTEAGPVKDWYWDAADIRAPPIWKAARDAKLTTSIVYWPSSVGAEVDWLIPEKWGGDKRELLLKISTPGLVEAIEKEAGPFDSKKENDKAYADDYLAKACGHILKTHKPALTLLHLIQADGAQHEHGREHDAVREAVKRVDGLVAGLLKALDEAGIRDTTTVVITGDHGFIDVAQDVALNTLFKKEGWYRGPADWDVVAHASGAQAAVYVRDAKLEKAVGELLERNRMDEEKPRYTLLDRDALKKLHAVPAAAFAISCCEGFTASERDSGTISRKANVRGNHGPLPDDPKLHTGLILHGAGVKAGARLDKAALVDVAPTIAALLKFEMKNVDGKALKELLQEKP